jgi:hypothetical protein
MYMQLAYVHVHWQIFVLMTLHFCGLIINTVLALQFEGIMSKEFIVG